MKISPKVKRRIYKEIHDALQAVLVCLICGAVFLLMCIVLLPH